MSKSTRHEEFLNLELEEFNRGNINFLMTLYGSDRCFASKPGQIVKDLQSIRQTLQGFIDMGAKLEAKAKRVLHTSDLDLLITEWSINGNEPAAVRWYAVYCHRKSMGDRLAKYT
jgi:ketosteroid isomerase-like protein